MIAKFHFFSHVAGFFKIYLMSFQTDSPMVPFMPGEIEKVFRKLCRWQEHSKRVYEDKYWSATTDHLRDTYVKSDIKKSFLKECFNMVVNILIGLQERSPLK